MTIQLNPTTSDAYETKTLAQLRQMIFDGMGFMNLFATTKTESLVSIRTDIFNMLGMAAMAANPPPGVTQMLNSFINEAQQTVFRAIESNLFGTALQSPPPMLVGDTDQTVYDGQVVRTLALGMAKAHYAQEDGQLYVASYQKYLNELKDRLPPNAITLVNRVLRDTQIMLYREYRVFRMERWFTWTLQVGQRFYPIAGNDERVALPTPSGVTAVAGPAGPWGSFNTARSAFGATILNNGKVLSVGGLDVNGSITATAETYDPATGLYSATGSMGTARLNPITIALDDGLVLVAGGFNGDSLQTSELYNPGIGAFSAAGSMTSPRSQLVPLKLKNGKVLFAGGTGTANTILQSAELFDQNTGAFTATGNMTTARTQYGAVALNTGHAVFAGGAGLTNAEQYDPNTGNFTVITPPVSLPSSSVGVLLGTGKALFCGGVNGGVTTDATFIFDPLVGNFNGPFGLVTMTTPRKNHTATLLQNGKVLIAGGQNAGGILSSAELYDPVANTFTAIAGGMPSARQNHTAILLVTGRVLIAGGDNSGGTLASAVIYDPASNTFSTSGTTTSGVYAYRVAFVDNNGKSTLASPEVLTAVIPAQTAVVVSWTPPANQNAKYATIYGRTAGLEKLIGQVDVTLGQYTDYMTIVPNGGLPTSNATGNVGPILDQRELSWVGVSQGDVGWRPLSKPIPPQAYTSQTSGVPNWYDIREQIEIWPPSPDPTWLLRIKGYFTLGPFEVDTDVTTIDWQAVYLWALALTKAEYKRQDANSALARAQAYVGDLVAGSHGTARYIPGRIERGSVTRPVMTGTFPYS